MFQTVINKENFNFIKKKKKYNFPNNINYIIIRNMRLCSHISKISSPHPTQILKKGFATNIYYSKGGGSTLKKHAQKEENLSPSPSPSSSPSPSPSDTPSPSPSPSPNSPDPLKGAENKAAGHPFIGTLSSDGKNVILEGNASSTAKTKIPGESEERSGLDLTPKEATRPTYHYAFDEPITVPREDVIKGPLLVEDGKPFDLFSST